MRLRDVALGDLDAVLDLDDLAPLDFRRTADIREWLDSGAMIVAEQDGRLLGYAVCDRSFFGRSFIRLVYIATSSRRGGVGRALVRAAEARAATPRIFTSTNASNTAMQSLLDSLGYTRCGEVRGLDEGDSEVFYFKDLSTSR